MPPSSIAATMSARSSHMKRLMVGTVNPRLTQFTAALALAIGIGAVVVGPGGESLSMHPHFPTLVS